MTTYERRANSRFTIRDDVTLKVSGETDSERCILEDLSKGGARFYSRVELAVGSHIELRIPSPDNEPDIIINATVLRVGPGIQDMPYAYACQIEHVENF